MAVRQGGGIAAAVAACVATLAIAAGAAAAEPTTSRVSFTRLGFERPHWSFRATMSGDGARVAYETITVDNGDRTTKNDIYLFDRPNGKTRLVSANSLNLPANGSSGAPALSADGRYVAFHSLATDLTADTGQGEVFVRDVDAGTTERVPDKAFGGRRWFAAFFPAVSADGRYVAFGSMSEEPGGGLYRTDVHLTDRETGRTEVIGAARGEGVDVTTNYPSISGDGRLVSFMSDGALVPADTNRVADVYLRDRSTGALTRPSRSSSEQQANGASGGAAVAGGGRYVAFTSVADNLVPGDANGSADVFVRDRRKGTTRCVSVGLNGKPANDYSAGASISADGRYVAFVSHASNLVRGDTNRFTDVFVRDLATGTTRRASISTSREQANYPSEGPNGSYESAISGDGRFVGFTSLASNLVSGDTNDEGDVFVRGPFGP